MFNDKNFTFISSSFVSFESKKQVLFDERKFHLDVFLKKTVSNRFNNFFKFLLFIGIRLNCNSIIKKFL
jgi:hypothetical protein